MENQRVRNRLRGITTAILTPFDDSHEINFEKLVENAATLYDRDIRTFMTVANISEYHSLSQDERIDIARECVESLPDDACILGGVGGSTGDARELIKGYDRHGVDVIMVMPPDHTYLHEQGLLDYYRNLAKTTDRPLVPYIRGFDPSTDFLASLTYIDSVIGIKYALKDPVKLGAAISRGADDVVWVDGLAEPYAVSYWGEGIEGFTAGVSNFRPEVGLNLYDALNDGNWARARAIRNICLPFQNFRNKSGADNVISGAISVPAVKKGLDMAGLHGGNIREPLRQLTASEEKRAEKLYQQLDTKIDELID